MRIHHLKVYTDKLQEQKDFYGNVLGLKLKEISEKSFQVEIGFSVLEFEYKEGATSYHVAFHISAHREEQALKWLKQRVDILKDNGNEIIDFSGWKAKSVYFYDPAKNVLEFISRRHYFPSNSENFSEEDIIGISEIGLATSNVKEKFDFLHHNFGLEKFTGDYDHFCATGDDEGLFIVIDKDQKDWIPTGDKAFSSPFEIEISADGTSLGAAFKNDQLNFL